MIIPFSVAVIEEYCVNVCRLPQDRCLAVCNLRVVAEINQRVANGADLDGAVHDVMNEREQSMSLILVRREGTAPQVERHGVFP